MEITNIGLRIYEGTGEGPHYDVNTDTLLSVNIPNLEKGHHGRLFRRKYGDPSNQTECHDMGHEYVSFVIPTKSGSLLTSQGKDIVELEWPSGGQASAHTIVHSVEAGKKTRFNDAKCDPRGRLFAGTMSLEKSPAVPFEEEVGHLFSLDTDRKLHIMDSKYTLSNGLAWPQDMNRMFFIDSVMNKVFVYDYDPDALKLTNRRVFLDFSAHPELGPSIADGCCIDRDQRLWIACFYGKRVICVDSTTGQITSEVKMPTACPTSCCFAGPSLNELVVTTSKLGALDSDTEAGSLYRVVNTGASGFNGVPFEG